MTAISPQSTSAPWPRRMTKPSDATMNDPLESWRRIAEDAASRQDWGAYHVNSAFTFSNPSGCRVLVIGCNRGHDCIPFVENGAASVVGVDIMDEIGIGFSHPRVKYIKHTAENIPLPDQSFDLIYSLATLEHIPDIKSAYEEMARLVSPGGTIYCVAAPLWHTRCGPHWGSAFDDEPWLHLRLSLDQIVSLGKERRFSDAQMRFFVGDHCNKRRPQEYLDACSNLGLYIIRNDIDIEPEFDSRIVSEVISMGYCKLDLFGLTHTLIARKPAVDCPFK